MRNEKRLIVSGLSSMSVSEGDNVNVYETTYQDSLGNPEKFWAKAADRIH